MITELQLDMLGRNPQTIVIQSLFPNILYNICVYTQNLFALQQLPPSPSQRQFKSALAVMVLLGAGWVFGFLLIIEEVNTAPLRWLFIIVNCSQVKGIVILIRRDKSRPRLQMFNFFDSMISALLLYKPFTIYGLLNQTNKQILGSPNLLQTNKQLLGSTTLLQLDKQTSCWNPLPFFKQTNKFLGSQPS